MIEVLYDAIRVTSDDESTILAAIADGDGELITEGEVSLVIDNGRLVAIGEYIEDAEAWGFTIPKSELSGRYMYHFEINGSHLQFAQPIYFTEG